ncbi:MAG: cation diffusion facilitator family transporter [Pseudomonadales bacterium]|nr:cation diffusion facilitator family transporter [Pseudomonadales bacterium]
MLNTESARHRLLTLATKASVATAFVLIIAKVVAWSLTGSVSILASLVDSMMDALASLINFFAVRYSLQPADDEHRHGHGKAEALAALAQSAFIAGSAFFLVVESIDRIFQPQPTVQIETGIGVIAFTILLTAALVLFQRYVIARTGSQAIKADSLHYMTDLATNSGILITLLLVNAGWGDLDSWFALLIAAYILQSAWVIAKEAMDLLMDRELPPSVQAKIDELVREHPEVMGMHKLRTRQSAQTYFIQMHLEINGLLTLRESHRIADQLEQKIKAIYPTADVIIHQDPV